VSFISVQNLTKAFGAFKALDNVSFSVEEGHTLALLGESGCGKTTMLRCIAGLEEPDSGRITIAGQTVFDAEAGINVVPEQRQLGIVFQSYAIWPHMSVADNVGFPLKVRRVAKAEMRSRVQRILDTVDLSSRIDHPASQLSGGQQQRVALARALIHEPRLVLFDEALSNLDAQLRKQMRMELKVLQVRLGFTAIYVTHDQEEAFGLAEHVVIMNRGRIEAAGSPRDLFWRPPTAFIAKFLGLNLLPGTVVGLSDEPCNRPRGSGPARYAQIQFDASGCLWGQIGAGPAIGLGDKVVTCVRKEHVRIAPARAGQTAAQGGSQGLMNGTIVASSFLGLAEEYVIKVSGYEICSVQPLVSASAGSDIDVVVEPDHCIVLLQDVAHSAA
jgi:iron(III) transport system ATP-binding protein